ncbi:electron transfer flavoprotein subunit alpha/FixB family protein [soil metagenome]
MRILVYIDLQDGVPTAFSRELAAGARGLAGANGTVDLAVFGEGGAGVGNVDADRVLIVSTSGASAYNPAMHGAWLDEAIAMSNPDLILFGYTTSGLDLGPALAMRRDMPVLSYCTAIRIEGDKVEVDSQIYSGKLISTAEVTLPAVLLVNSGTFRESEAEQARTPEVVELAAPTGAQTTVTFVSASQPDPNAIDITKASRLLCVGRGIGDQDTIEEAREAAGLMGGELVGSRPIVDAGWLPKERQVGKSGRKVKPQLYIALGVSGAPEHIEGMGSAGLIVAINTDAAAPIFDHAHIGATVDVADFLPAFKEALTAKAG